MILPESVIKLLRLIIIMLIMAFGIHYLLQLFYYIDYPNFCYVSIRANNKEGNKKTIIKAINQIKTNDFETYKEFCKYVDTIYENDCGILLYGCYIKGSKSIYLYPNLENSEEVMRQRMESIIKYTRYSKNFWELMGK